MSFRFFVDCCVDVIGAHCVEHCTSPRAPAPIRQRTDQPRAEKERGLFFLEKM